MLWTVSLNPYQTRIVKNQVVNPVFLGPTIRPAFRAKKLREPNRKLPPWPQLWAACRSGSQQLRLLHVAQVRKCAKKKKTKKKTGVSGFSCEYIFMWIVTEWEYLTREFLKPDARSCHALKEAGERNSGKFIIDPDGEDVGSAPIEVFCDFSGNQTGDTRSRWFYFFFCFKPCFFFFAQARTGYAEKRQWYCTIDKYSGRWRSPCLIRALSKYSTYKK